MKDQPGSPLVSIIVFGNVSTVVDAIREQGKPTTVQFFGSKTSRSLVIIENSIRSAFLVINDWVTHQANVFSPIGVSNACGLGRIHGYEGIDC